MSDILSIYKIVRADTYLLVIFSTLMNNLIKLFFFSVWKIG